MTDLRAEDPGIHLRRERLSENCPHLAETAALRERVKELERVVLVVRSCTRCAEDYGRCGDCDSRLMAALAAGSKEGA